MLPKSDGFFHPKLRCCCFISLIWPPKPLHMEKNFMPNPTCCNNICLFLGTSKGLKEFAVSQMLKSAAKRDKKRKEMNAVIKMIFQQSSHIFLYSMLFKYPSSKKHIFYGMLKSNVLVRIS